MATTRSVKSHDPSDKRPACSSGLCVYDSAAPGTPPFPVFLSFARGTWHGSPFGFRS